MEIGVTIHILNHLTEDNTLDHDSTRHAFTLEQTQTYSTFTQQQNHSHCLLSQKNTEQNKTKSSSNHGGKSIFGHTEYHVFAFLSIKSSLNQADRSHQIKKIVCTIFYTNKVLSKSEKYVLLIITSIFMIYVINPVAKLTKYTF